MSSALHRLGEARVVGEHDHLPILRRARKHHRETGDLAGIHRLDRVVDDHEAKRRLGHRRAGQEQRQRKTVQLALAHHAERGSVLAVHLHVERKPPLRLPHRRRRSSPSETLLSWRSSVQFSCTAPAIGRKRSSRNSSCASFSQRLRLLEAGDLVFRGVARRRPSGNHSAIASAAGRHARSNRSSSAAAARRRSRHGRDQRRTVRLEMARQRESVIVGSNCRPSLPDRRSPAAMSMPPPGAVAQRDQRARVTSCRA